LSRIVCPKRVCMPALSESTIVVDFVKAIVIWGLIALAAFALAGLLAGIKNRDVSTWMGWSFLLPPLVFVLALLPRLEGPRPRRPQPDHHH
jgi:hypothetical protein